MMRTMLVGLDGSPNSQVVLELGIDWAREYDAQLVGIGVIDVPGIHGPEEWVVGKLYFKRLNQEILDDLTRKTERALETAASRCRETGTAIKLLRNVGVPHHEIQKESQRYDLILLGSETHFQVASESTADSTLTHVLRDSPRPVVVVPGSKAVEPRAGEAVVVAYDGSLQASRALYAFESSGLGKGRDVHVVSIASEHETAVEQAGRAVEFLGSHGIEAMPTVLESNDPPETVILAQVDRLKAGLIVMGAYGKPSVRAFFLGSTTRKMLREARVPLFLSH